jgi:branched-subunit amino acid aminotransferase/4-amino-4-deoxychorismate lyase
VTPVRELDARRLGVGPVTRRLQERYQEMARGERVGA